MPTRRGRLMLVSSLVLYLLARAGSIAELYALAAGTFVFPVGAMAFVRWGRHSLRFERAVGPRRVFAGHDVRVSVTVRNLAGRASPPLVLEDDAHSAFGGPIRVAVPAIPRGKETSVAAVRSPSHRGRFRIGPLRAQLIDPFGLAQMQREVAPAAAVVVYPRIELLGEEGPPESQGGGGRSAVHRIAPAGDDFYGVRGWQDGDDLRKIHWRSTARFGELMIRQDDVRPFPRATLFIDTRSSEHRESRSRSSIEYSISAAASIVWELARQGFALRMATADAGPGGPRWGREAVDPLLGALAVAPRSSARSLVTPLRRMHDPAAGGALIAILPPPPSDAVAVLTRLRRAYHWCGAVLIDSQSFLEGSARERAIFDQRLAEADRFLERAGWHVMVAGSFDPFRTIWQRLIVSGAYRPNLPSRRS